MVGDKDVEDTVGPGFEWVSYGLKHGMCFFIGKTALGAGMPKPTETATGRRMRTGTMSLVL
jgi:hypothetical protein